MRRNVLSLLLVLACLVCLALCQDLETEEEKPNLQRYVRRFRPLGMKDFRFPMMPEAARNQQYWNRRRFE
ncbi:unnamed protein product, partial [Mesorhabditis spiculigera]